MGDLAAGDGIQEEDGDAGLDNAAHRFAAIAQRPPRKRRAVAKSTGAVPPVSAHGRDMDVEADPGPAGPTVDLVGEVPAIDELAVIEGLEEAPFDPASLHPERLPTERRVLNLNSTSDILPEGCTLRMYPSRDDPDIGFWEGHLPPGGYLQVDRCVVDAVPNNSR